MMNFKDAIIETINQFGRGVIGEACFVNVSIYNIPLCLSNNRIKTFALNNKVYLIGKLNISECVTIV